MTAVNLRLSVSDITAVLASFDVIQIRRSTTGSGGPFSLITAVTPASATLLAPTAGNYTVVGKTLSLLIDSDPKLDVVFTGTDPLTSEQVADQINTAAAKTIAADDGLGALKLTSTLTGTASKVEIDVGTAEADFGWVDGDRNSGKDAHISLIAGQTLYSYTDNDGDNAFFYTSQFLNTTTGLVSTESAPFLGAPGPILQVTDLSIAKIDLVDASGVAVPGQKITFYSVHDPLQVGGFSVALQRAPITIETDNLGHAEVSLVRGLKVKVVFEGTSIIREITVPAATEFDLLTALGSSPDPFDIEIIPFPAAPRRSV